MRRSLFLFLLAAALAAGSGPGVLADVDLTVLPERDSLQITVYNSADLTLVKEVRTLTLRKGDNKLSFAWVGTLIDPTSVSLRAPQHGDKVELVDASYPPRVAGKAVWTVRSEVEGAVPVEISYFISGVSWRAFYMATLARDEATVKIDGYVRVENRSGDDFPEAQVRLVVGKVNLLDQIAALARRTAPYGTPPRAVPAPPPPRPTPTPTPTPSPAPTAGGWAKAKRALDREKEIVKEGLSEYFVYTIEGTETIPNGWGKRLPSFHAEGVKVVNLFKYEEERWGNQVRRFLLFKNDKEHKLGDTPMPDGVFKVYRVADDGGRLSFESTTATKYIPVDQKCELDLGPASKVLVEPVLMEQRFENHSFDRRGNVSGFDEIQGWTFKVKNRRSVPVRLEIRRNFRHQHTALKNAGDFGRFETHDLDTVVYTLEFEAGAEKTFAAALTYFEGERRNRR